jgi:hypothetical protein
VANNAHTFLAEEKNRKLCYDFVVRGMQAQHDIPSFNPQSSAGPRSFQAGRIFPTNALVKNNVKVRIFIPLKIHRLSSVTAPQLNGGVFGDEKPQDGGTGSPYRFGDANKFDFHWLAKNLTNMLHTGCIQVGVDFEEVFPIVAQHSYYKYFNGIYGVETEVNLYDLILERLSERDISDPRQLNWQAPGLLDT